MDNKWDGNRPAAIRLAPAESGAGGGPLPARCWHDGGSDGSAGAGPLHIQFALSPPVRCRLRRRVWIGLDLFNDDTRPSGHISRPAQVNVSQSGFHSLNNYSSLIILYTSGG